MNESEIWRRILEILNSEVVPKRIHVEIPLSVLGNILFPMADSNELKHWNREVSRILRKHGVRIERRHHGRVAIFPPKIVEASRKKKKRMKLEVEEVWKW